ncbi:MAG TPA: pitrilysin family protein [Burkholderiales bacterium]|jgi:zinc protease|nr:pitrilysin family protein [Burkholderiales bacterium]
MKLMRKILMLGLLCVAGVAQAALPVQTWTAKSGAKVLFVESRSIPMLDVNIDFDAGARYDTAAKSGLSAMTSGMLGLGAEGMDEESIANGFADVGAQRGASADNDRAGASLRTLSSVAERDAALKLFANVIQAPTFPETVLAREKQRSIAGLKEAETKPDSIADRAFSKAMYGNHPYAFDPTEQSVSAITRADIAAFYHDNYSAKRAVVTMIGDISRAEAEAIAEQITAKLPAGAPPPVVPPVGAPDITPIRIAHPATQAHVLIGAPALKRGDPDYFPLMVGNYVLGGGGFVSRLMREVREKRGLAYSVYSYFMPLKDEGPFQIGLQTKKEQVPEALDIVKRVVADYVANGPTAKELQAAKDNLIGGFPLRIDNNRKLLDNLAVIGFYNLPLDYLDTWTANVNRVTVAEVKADFAKRVHPDAMASVVVGMPQ